MEFGRTATIVCLLGCAAACDPGPSPQQLRTASVQATLSPGALEACPGRKGARGVLAWRIKNESLREIDAFVLEQGKEKLFVTGGVKSEATTGAWIFPGTRFVLRDHATGRSLGLLEVRSIPCRS